MENYQQLQVLYSRDPVSASATALERELKTR